MKYKIYFIQMYKYRYILYFIDILIIYILKYIKYF